MKIKQWYEGDGGKEGYRWELQEDGKKIGELVDQLPMDVKQGTILKIKDLLYKVVSIFDCEKSSEHLEIVWFVLMPFVEDYTLKIKEEVVISEKTMKKLTYTEEMEKEDKLWESQNEDLDKMERFYNQIIDEAKEKGFTGVTHIYSVGSEMLCQIFNNQEERELEILGKFDDFEEVGYCKPLIEKLENMINK